MSSPDVPENQRPASDAENAMDANARSRDRQGKAEDKVRRERRLGPTGGGTQGQTPPRPAERKE